MENLSEIIPLLIIVVSIVLSAVSSSKKKKAESAQRNSVPNAPSPQAKRSPNEILWDERKETLEKENIRQTVAQPVYKQKNATKYYSQNFMSEKESKTVMSEEGYSQPYIDVSDLDEVKKAVIYTEIFTRKEY